MPSARAGSRSTTRTCRCSRLAAAAPTASDRRCGASAPARDELGAARRRRAGDRRPARARPPHRRARRRAAACAGVPEWRDARAFLGELLAEIGVAPELDEAGNLWAYLEGEAEPALALGSHVDSVPDGGWLDGALGVMAAVGVLRGWAASGRPTRRGRSLSSTGPTRRARASGGACSAAPPWRARSSRRSWRACAMPTASRSPRCWRRTTSIWAGRPRRHPGANGSPPTSSCTSSRARCSRPRA